MKVLADTGCQACCMGPSQLHALGLSRKDLLQPILSLKAANTSGINIIGVVFLMITGWDRNGGHTRSATCRRMWNSCCSHERLACS